MTAMHLNYPQYALFRTYKLPATDLLMFVGEFMRNRTLKISLLTVPLPMQDVCVTDITFARY